MKRKLFLFLRKYNIFPDWFMKIMELVNAILFHWDGRQHMTHPGNEDPDKIYYVIRSASRVEGLCSLYLTKGLSSVAWAEKRGYIPFIDFSSPAECQYCSDQEILGTNNAWEYYFEQPCDVTREEIQRKKNVLLSGWTVREEKDYISAGFENLDEQSIKRAIDQCKVKQYLWALADEKKNVFMNDGKTLGVLIRGTDYTALKPKGHSVQPSVSQVIDKIKEFQAKHDIAHVLVVTEDRNIFLRVREEIGNIAFSCDEHWAGEYKANDYVESSIQGDQL